MRSSTLLQAGFFYASLIVSHGGIPVRVAVNYSTYLPEIAAIESSITVKTRAVIINSPHNPTGKIYDKTFLINLGVLLRKKSQQFGKTIFLISDEVYNLVLMDNNKFEPPAAYYDNTFVCYSFAKQLLSPGQRIGFLAIHPNMVGSTQVFNAAKILLAVSSYSYPNAVMQYSLKDIMKISLDLKQLQHKRDVMVKALTSGGYQFHVPQGSFYILVKCPINENSFVDKLADEHVYVLPGSICEAPGYFRISLTASIDMIEKGAAVIETLGKQLKIAKL